MTGGDAHRLTIMAQQHHAKDVKRKGQLQLGCQARIIWPRASYAGNNARHTLKDGKLFCRGRVCFRFHYLPDRPDNACSAREYSPKLSLRISHCNDIEILNV